MIKSMLIYNWRFRRCGRRSVIIQPDFLLKPNNMIIGNNVDIRKGARLEAIGTISDRDIKINIGDGTSIHYYFHCGAAKSITIGKKVLIASRVYITDHDHEFDNNNLPPINSGLVIKPVVIEDEVWIGEGAVILKGVRIGKRAVIGANSVVTKDVLPYEVVAGVPAKKIKLIRFYKET